MTHLVCFEEQSASYDDFVVYAQFVKMANGFLLLITDQESFGFGTIALASPPSGISDKSLSSPFNLFGLKHSLLSNVIGKTTSKHLHQPVLTMLLIKNTQLKPKIIMETAMKAVNKALEHIQSATPPTSEE